jgi:hypothetical protein
MTDYTEFLSKTQDEILHNVKQAQETNVKALTHFGEAIAEYAAKARTITSPVAVPTPAEIISSTFGFAAQLVDLQKQYYVKIAETFASAQKKATEAVMATAKKADSK